MKHYYICTLCILHLCRNCQDFVAAAGHAGICRICFCSQHREFSDFAFSYVHRRVRGTRVYYGIMRFSAQRRCNCFYSFPTLRGLNDKDTLFFKRNQCHFSWFTFAIISIIILLECFSLQNIV